MFMGFSWCFMGAKIGILVECMKGVGESLSKILFSCIIGFVLICLFETHSGHWLF